MKLGVAALGWALLLGGTANAVPKASAQAVPAEAPKRKVKTKVLPEIPELAKQLKVTGKVKIEATVSADGHVTGTKVVGGSPVLVPAANDALKKWRYEPAAKETTEIVEFDFGNQN